MLLLLLTHVLLGLTQHLKSAALAFELVLAALFDLHIFLDNAEVVFRRNLAL